MSRVGNVYDFVNSTVEQFNTPELNGTNGWKYDETLDYLAKYGRDSRQDAGGAGGQPTAEAPTPRATIDRADYSAFYLADKDRKNAAYIEWKNQYKAEQDAEASRNRQIDELQNELDRVLAEGKSASPNSRAAAQESIYTAQPQMNLAEEAAAAEGANPEYFETKRAADAYKANAGRQNAPAAGRAEELAAQIEALGGTPNMELPTLPERVSGSISSGALGAAGSFINALGTVYQSGRMDTDLQQMSEEAKGEYEKALRDYTETLEEYNGDESAPDVVWARNILDSIKQKYDIKADNYNSYVTENADKIARLDANTERILNTADTFTAAGQIAGDEAKRGLGEVGVFLVDAGGQLVQMGGDMLVNMAVPGAGTAAMATRAFGSAAQEARQAGASEREQFLYSLGSAGVELLTEKISGIGNRIAYGKGLGDDLTETVIGALTQSDVGRTVLRTLAGMGGEGAEEMLSDALNPILKSIYNHQSIRQNYSELDTAQMLYDGLMGAAMGAFGQGVNIVTGADAEANRRLLEPEKAKSQIEAGKQSLAENAESGMRNDISAEPLSHSVTAPPPSLSAMPTSLPAGESLPLTGEARAERGRVNLTEQLKALTPTGGTKPVSGADLLAYYAQQNTAPAATVSEPQSAGDINTPTAEQNAPTGQNTEFNAAEGKTVSEKRAELEKRIRESMTRYDEEAEKNGMSDELMGRYNAEMAAFNAEEVQLKKEETAEQARTVQNKRIQDGFVSKDFGKAQNHIDNRTSESVAKPSVKAFQFDHPELHGYFVEAAEQMRQELITARDAITASRYAHHKGIIDDRISPISSLRTFMSIPEIDRCLEDIIANNGQENYANAKRVELVLDKMMSDGWDSIGERKHFPPNSEYRAAKDSISGGIKADSFEQYLKENELSLISGDVTEDELRAEFEKKNAEAVKNDAGEQVAGKLENAPVEPIFPASEGKTGKAGQVKTGQEYLTEAAGSGKTGTQNGTQGGSAAGSDSFTDFQPTEGKKKTSQTPDTIQKAETLTEGTRADIAKYRKEGAYDYFKDSTKAQKARAEEKVKSIGWRKAVSDFHADVSAGRSSADMMAMGAVLLNEASNGGATTAEYMDIMYDNYVLRHNWGRTGATARNLLNSLTPDGQLYMMEKAVQEVNENMTPKEKSALSKEQKNSAKPTGKEIEETVKTAKENVTDKFTFEYSDEAGKMIAKAVEKAVSPAQTKQKTAIETLVGRLSRFAVERVKPQGRKAAKFTATDLLSELANNEEFAREAYALAREQIRRDAPENIEAMGDFTDASIDLRDSKIVKRAVSESAVRTEENAETIRQQHALGILNNTIADRIANDLIKQTNASADIAVQLRETSRNYVNEILNGDTKTEEGRVSKIVEAALKNIGETFRKLAVSDNYSRETAINAITNELAEQYGVSKKDANLIGWKVTNEYTNRLQLAIDEELMRRYDPVNFKALKEAEASANGTEASEKVPKTVSQKLAEAVNLGAFDSQYAEEATKKLFGTDGLKLDNALVEKFRNAKTDEERSAVLEEIKTDIEKRIPATFKEKTREWRHVGMLLRPKTHIKNFLANVPTMFERKPAERLSAAMQGWLVKSGKLDAADRTRAVPKEVHKAAAQEYFEANKTAILEQGDKYSKESGGKISFNKTIFKNAEAFEKTRQFVYKALELEDSPFVKSAFTDSLAQYCAAHDITSSEAVTSEAIDFAVQNAAEATYKLDTVISDFLARAKNTGNPAVDTLVDIIQPFTKTMANLARTGVQYSPLGFTEVLSPKKTTAQKTDAVSKATVGTFVTFLGAMMRAKGWITGAPDKDEDKANLDKSTGNKPYSFGGKSSYLWIQPFGFQLSMGAAMYDAMSKGDGLFQGMIDSFIAAGDTLFENELFSNVNKIMQGYGSKTEEILRTAGESVVSQYIPGFLSDLAKAMDDTTRSTYTGGNFFDNALAKAENSLPWLSKYLPPSVNVKGEDVKRIENGVLRFVNEMVNPFGWDSGKRSEVDELIYEVYEETGKTTHFPRTAPTKLTIGSDDYTLTGTERALYQATMGHEYYKLAEEMRKDDIFLSMTAEEQNAVLTELCGYSEAMSKREFLMNREISREEDKNDKISALKDPAGYLVAYAAFKNAGSDRKKENINYEALDIAVKNYGKLGKAARDLLEESNYHVKDLKEARQKGVKSEEWYRVYDSVKAAEDKNNSENGKTKFEGLVNSGASSSTVDALASQYLGKGQYERGAEYLYNYMRDMGYSPKQAYSFWKDADKPTADGKDGNGSLSQDEVYSMRGKYPDEMLAELWDKMGWKTSFYSYRPKK